MTHKELDQTLRKLGIPVAYSHFANGQKPPFITFRRVDGNNIFADDRVWVKRQSYDIELYTDKKDEELEAKLEDLLDEYVGEYEVTETYMEDERLFETVYEIQIGG